MLSATSTKSMGVSCGTLLPLFQGLLPSSCFPSLLHQGFITISNLHCKTLQPLTFPQSPFSSKRQGHQRNCPWMPGGRLCDFFSPLSWTLELSLKPPLPEIWEFLQDLFNFNQAARGGCLVDKAPRPSSRQQRQ